MANNNSRFLLGLAQSITSGVKSRQDEERAMASKLAEMIMKAKMERELAEATRPQGGRVSGYKYTKGQGYVPEYAGDMTQADILKEVEAQRELDFIRGRQRGADSSPTVGDIGRRPLENVNINDYQITGGDSMPTVGDISQGSTQGKGQVVPTGFDKFGNPTGFKDVGLEMQQKQFEADAKEKATQKGAEKMSKGNVYLVAGGLSRLAQGYADAYKEGGVGSRVKSVTSGARLWLGGEAAEGLPATGAFEGQKIEVVAKMMPLLTQQGDNPGSVRLVESIFRKVMNTLPDEHTPPTVAKRMMTTTIQNMIGFAKAIEDMGINTMQMENLSPMQVKSLTNSIERYAKSIEYTESEQRQMEDLLKKILGPIDEVIANKASNKSRKLSSGLSYTIEGD